ncbi:MAG TPA: PEP-CTERM sorting domain-containing protein [Gemmatales bacterium]|nr:PEP-CTERM sorting domain-containing protein [Gemmatales bacterium]
MRTFMIVVAAVFLVSHLGAQTSAVYNFETAPFFLSSTTPFTNAPPASGPGGFTATFTSAPTASGVSVNFTSLGFFGFSSQFLNASTPQTLTVTFNVPVITLSVNFTYTTGQTTPPAHFEADVGSNVYSGGTSSPGGTLNFTNPTPFSSVVFFAIDNTGSQTAWAIDNLTLTPAAVPEPATVALLGFSVAGVAGAVYWWRRKHRQLTEQEVD